ncbi:MAG: SDR family NAD(P)-dependent oxidoreductase [Candidatus Obscuribacterales bacterium]|nr:SDR family NAD(P)-dependent oxidoreductase [Candidatus Obscuribacterales bacterium]
MDLKDKRILVTGGAGFIGSNLVEELIKKGNEIIVLDDYSAGKESNLASVKQSGKLHLIKGSILDPLMVRKLVKEVDVVFHLAAHCSRLCFDRPHNVHEVNATGTLNVLDAMKLVNRSTNTRRVKRLVYCSSSEVYGTAKNSSMTEEHTLEPTTVFGASKLAAEHYTQVYHATWGLPTVIVRPFNTYGYRAHHAGASGEVIPRFAVRILNDLPPIIFGDGSQTRDFTFVSDVVQGLITAGGSDNLIGKTINIASGKEVTIKEIAERLLKLLGKEQIGIQFEPSRPGDVNRQVADASKVEKLVEFRSTIGIDQGLPLYIEWLKEQKLNNEQLLKEMPIQNWKTDDADMLASTRH